MYIKKNILGTQTTYFEVTLHVGIEFWIDYSPNVV
jgi:hypothetical protein